MLFGNHKNSSFASEKAARMGGNFQNRADLVTLPGIEPGLPG